MQAENGILLLDKPGGISSAGAVRRVKKHLGAEKVGHAGTLDPFATGLLVCCINQATRLAQFLMRSNKTYRARLMLGVETDTQDATGAVVAAVDAGRVDPQRVTQVFSGFLGWQQQQPPVYSALKHRGMPLYKLARKGRPVQKPPRHIRIDSLDIIRMDLPTVDFEVTCSAGTYIRTLCADMGRTLGCGGHLASLRRIRCGGFSVDEAATLASVEQAPAAVRLMDMANALHDMPTVAATSGMKAHIRHGRLPAPGDLPPTPESGQWVKIVGSDNRLLAVMEFDPTRQQWRYCCVLNAPTA